MALAQPGGPVEEGFFKGLLAELGSGLKAALPVDGVFVSCHGAALAQGTDDPDGDLFEMVRSIVGALVKVGEGRMTVEFLQSVVKTKKRTELVETAPAHGLFLWRVFY